MHACTTDSKEKQGNENKLLVQQGLLETINEDSWRLAARKQNNDHAQESKTIDQRISKALIEVAGQVLVAADTVFAAPLVELALAGPLGAAAEIPLWGLP